jgi:AAA15 family ATPase/GTPase
MIVSFSVSNFRSFSTEETFSLVASSRLSGGHENHTVRIPDSKERVLRVAALYGANAAGKSNVLKALRYLRAIALEQRPSGSGTGREIFRFGHGSEHLSTFDLQFIAGNKLYRFGCKVDDHRIAEEWLVRVIGQREKPLYERVTTLDGKVVIEASGLSNLKMDALATVGGPQNQAFLATIRGTIEPSDWGVELAEILSWFNQTLNLVEPDAPLAKSLGRSLSSDSDMLEFAGQFLNSASTGVKRLETAEAEVAPVDLAKLMVKDVPQFVSTILHGEFRTVKEREEGEARIYQLTVKAAHQDSAGRTVSLEMAEESDGTRRLLSLIPALHSPTAGGAVYFIDEIDRSMHPMLVRQFLDFFIKSCADSNRQIIVTTHEAHLLDQDLLRRDEIWFAEKDQDGATHLYSLMDFKVRNDLELRKGYLQGRFGAVPFLGDIDSLLPATGSAT